MLPPNLSRWILNDETRNILFFAQLIEELLFNYSIDIYKVPVCDAKVLCRELLQILGEADVSGFDETDFRPVLEELIQEIQKDPIVEEVAPALREDLVVRLSGISDWNTLTPLLQQLQNFLEMHYIERVGDLLREKITKGDRPAIVRLTKVFLTELIDIGYSPEHIFFENKSFFFDPQGRSITSYADLDEFLRRFSSIPKFWSVVFRTGKDFKYLNKFPVHMNISADTSCPDAATFAEDKNISIFLDKNFRLSGYLTFVDIEAFDGFSARQIAEQKLLSLEKFTRFHVHRTELEWSRAALVYDLEKSTSGIYGKPVAAILKRPDHSAGQLSRLLNNTIVTVFSDKLDDDSIQRLLRSFQRHNTALSATAVESQLLELWSGIEALFPAPRRKTDDSARIVRNLVHYATRGYAAKVAADLVKSIRNSEAQDAMKIVETSTPGNNIIEKILLLVADESRSEQREALRKALGEHALLIWRLDDLHAQFHSAAAYAETLRAYAVSTAWQARRIMRAVITLRDSGKEVLSINKLVETLHSYLDRVMDVLLEEIVRKRDVTTLADIHQEVATQFTAHEEILRTRRGERVTADNFRFIFFGDSQ